jgi:superfamily II DNA/RNA helicase
VRELSSQIAEVYQKICEFSDIKVSNYTATGKSDGQHIVVTTLGKLNNALKGGRGKKTIDLSELRCFVVDEADVFF